MSCGKRSEVDKFGPHLASLTTATRERREPGVEALVGLSSTQITLSSSKVLCEEAGTCIHDRCWVFARPVVHD